MRLTLRSHKGVLLDRIELPDDATGSSLTKFFNTKYHYYPERQKWTINAANGPLLTDTLLTAQGVKDDSTLFFKDLGVQVSWRVVFCVEYFGPLIIFPLLYYLPGLFYPTVAPKNQIQTSAFFMLMFHFAKRELESLFVHRFSRSTMPLFCGVGIGYYLFHPLFLASPLVADKRVQTALIGFFILFEFLNFMTHITLRDLRPAGTSIRNIPYGWGYQYVSCAHYLWEVCCWVTFSLLVQTISAYAFTTLAFLIMTKWALKKHKAYYKHFPDYPKSRKAIIPFIL